MCRDGTSGLNYGARATFKLCKYDGTPTNSRSRLDITLAHNFYDDITAMSIVSNGHVGIGTTSPQQSLHLHKNATAQDTRIQLTDGTTTSGAFRGFHIGKNVDGEGFLYNFENKDISFGTNVTERMRIASNGNIGIGTTAPSAKLHLNTVYDDINSSLRIDGGASVYNLIIYSYVIDAGQVGWRFRSSSIVGGTNTSIQISSNGSVYFPVGSSSASDSRIKKDIEDINDDTALNKLLLIQPKTYNYIEEGRNKGFGKVYGFIAQQIREVIPEAVTIIKKETIPNIYKSCLIKNKREVYHSIPLNTPIDTFIKINNDSYKIKEIYEDYFVIDNDIDSEEVFVFGYSVDDFHTLKKDYIFTLNVCATQELHRRIEAQNIIIKSHEDRIKDLEEKVERLLTNT